MNWQLSFCKAAQPVTSRAISGLLPPGVSSPLQSSSMMSPMRVSFLSGLVTVSVVSASFASSFTVQPSTVMGLPSAVFAFTLTVFLPASRVRKAFGVHSAVCSALLAGKRSGVGSSGFQPLKTPVALAGSAGAMKGVPYLPVLTMSSVFPSMLPPARWNVRLTVFRS